jgi:imidazolonepropionase-like amidohydrolase
MTAAEAAELRDKMASLVEKGLPPEAVLAALTRTPAELLGIAGDLGTIKAGALANLTIVEGDLFKKDGKVKCVIVKGQKLETAAVTAEGPRRGPTTEDGAAYANVAEDDADGHGGDDE